MNVQSVRIEIILQLKIIEMSEIDWNSKNTVNFVKSIPHIEKLNKPRFDK